MEKIEFLNYLEEIGLTPKSYWNERTNIVLFDPTAVNSKNKDIERLIKLYGKNTKLLNQIEELNTAIKLESVKEFTIQEVVVTEQGEGYGEEVAIILYVPEFNFILKSSGNYYSYSDVDNFSDWQIFENSKNTLKVKYA